MDEINKHGIKEMLRLAYQHISQGICGFGISIDVDAIDPKDAPGVGYREPNGISAKALIHALHALPHPKPLLGLEIAEFNPIQDKNNKTASLVIELIQAVYNS